MTVKRKLTTIMCADVVGYSRLMGVDEPGTLRRLKGCRELMAGFIEHHHGRVVSWSGDAVLADFASVVEAVQCAIEVQRELKARNETVPDAERMEFRICVNVGDVMVEEHDIFGEGVNIAARLQTLAPPGGILISGAVHEQVKNKLSVGFDFLGRQQVKNIAQEVPAYVVLHGAVAQAATLAALTDAQLTEETASRLAVSRAVLLRRIGAGSVDAALAGGLVFGIAVALSAAGAPFAKTALPFGFLTSERVVVQGEPETEIKEGGALVVTRTPTTVNRTLLGLATETYRIWEIESVRTRTDAGKPLNPAETRTSRTEEQIYPRSGRPVDPPHWLWFAIGAYLVLMIVTEGVGTRRVSPGKAVFGLRVTDTKGKATGLLTALVRNAAKLVSLPPLMAGFLLAFRTRQAQAFHDLLAGAVVTEKTK
ncbi:MAG TPA: hypothetical protein DCL54_05425 [Alphaproteobacteria bacterium]|nr:hypothetical protein [Alphaproteobacteria bacterium]HAJ46004.1 hypothetical protein [Alphaproteobacteria bacterium]